MKLVIAADHAGFPRKEEERGYLERFVRRLRKVKANEARHMPESPENAKLSN